MARPRTSVETLALAYTIAQSSGIEKAAQETGISERTIHSVVWAMDIVPQIKKKLREKPAA